MFNRFAATNGSASRDALPLVAAKRLALFAPNLFGGGAERTLARLATHWADQGRDVTLITLASVSGDDFSLSPNVRRIGLGITAEAGGLWNAASNNVRRIRALRETLRTVRPDLVVSFIEQANVLALLAARPLRVPVVIAERTDPKRHPVGRIWQWLRQKTYPRCAALVVLTDEFAKQMAPIVRGRPIVVIPNGIDKPELAVGEVPRSPLVLAVGRLDAAKGFDRLIDAFARVAEHHPEWRLAIVGEGPERQALESLISRHHLQGRVELPGRVADPGDWFQKSALFALSSRYEGFPNALLEAMACGAVPVAFDGPSAVREVVRSGTDGLLVPDSDIEAYAAALEELMSQGDRRTTMSIFAREVVQRFPLHASLDRWDAVVDAAASKDFSQLFAADNE